MPTPLERCARCQRTISQYEMPRIWQETIVCAECYTILSASANPPAPKYQIQSEPVVAPPVVKPPAPAAVKPAARTAPLSGVAAHRPAQAQPQQPGISVPYAEPLAAAPNMPQRQTPRVPASSPVGKAAKAFMAVGILQTVIGGIMALPMLIGVVAALSSGGGPSLIGAAMMFLVFGVTGAAGVWSLFLAKQIRAGGKTAAIIALVITVSGALLHLLWIAGTVMSFFTPPESGSKLDVFGEVLAPFFFFISSAASVTLLSLTVNLLIKRLNQAGAYTGPVSAPYVPRPAPVRYSPPTPPREIYSAPAAAPPSYAPAYSGRSNTALSISRPRKIAGRLLIALGICLICMGALFIGFSFLALAIMQQQGATLADFPWEPFCIGLGEVGCGITFLTTRGPMVRGSRPATLITLILAYAQTLLCSIALFNTIRSTIEMPISSARAGPAGNMVLTTIVLTFIVVYAVLLGFAAMLIPLLINLHRIMGENAAPVAYRGGKRSLLPGATIGAAAGTTVGLAITIGTSLYYHKASASAGLDIMTPLSLLGAYLGYQITVTRRTAAGEMNPADKWQTLFGSGRAMPFILLTGIAVFILAMCTSFSMKAYLGSAGLEDSQVAAWQPKMPRIPRPDDSPRDDPTPPQFPQIPQIPQRPPQPPQPTPQPPKPPPPPALSPAEKLAKIATFWQPAASGPVDLLFDMKDAPPAGADHVVTIANRKRIATTQQLAAPSDVRIILQTHLGDTRLGFPAQNIIFNWEIRHDELRINGGPASGRHKGGVGQLPDNEWTAIEIITQPKELRIYVDGELRYTTDADFTRFKAPFALENHSDTPLKILSITQVQPR